MQPLAETIQNNQPNLIPPGIASGDEDKTFMGRVWKLIKSPFVWLIEKIIRLGLFLFASSPPPQPKQQPQQQPKQPTPPSLPPQTPPLIPTPPQTPPPIPTPQTPPPIPTPPQKPLPEMPNKKEIPQDKNVRGITNIGNSCYMNSVLQAMFASDTLTAHIDQDLPLNSSLSCSNRSTLEIRTRFKNFKDIYHETATQKESHTKLKKGIEDFRQTVFSYNISPVMCGLTQQQDAAELMRPLLDKIGYQFSFNIKTTNEDEAYWKEETEPEQMLLLQLPNQAKPIPLEELLTRFQLEKIRDPKNAWKPKDGVAYANYDRKFSIKGKIPNVLVIQLKRFSYYHPNSVKIETPVEVKEEMDFQALFDPQLKLQGESTRYKLCSYINHIGVTGGGHYTANRKDKVWRKCNDSVVSQINSQDETKDRHAAYILVFERILKPV